MSVKKYLTLNGLTYFLSKIKSTMADELDGKSDVGHTHTKSDITDLPTLATVATSGSYTDLDDKPTINDSTITIQKNGSTVDTFTTNGSNKTINIPVPTKTSDLTNDSNFVDTSNSAVASGITSAKVTDYDSHIADTDIHVTSSDKTTWNTVTSKANDSDVVHKSGDETVGGQKTFNDLQIIEYGTKYKGARNAYILPEFSAGYSGLAITTLGFSQSVKIGNYVLDSNNKPSLDSSKGYIQVLTGENNGVNACMLEPKNTTSSSLGTSSNKWGGIYATNYYYGSNNVEFSTKFVTTDTAQTISGIKNFSSNMFIYNSDDTATTPNLYLKSSKIEISSQGNTSGDQNLAWLDKNNTSYAYVKGAIQSNGSAVKIRAIAKDSSDNSVINELQILANTNGRKIIFPTYSNEIELGDSTYKWKSFNGVEPSLLSLPSQTYVDISSYFTNTGTGEHNTYTAPSNGWIFLRLGNISGCQADIFDTNNNRMWGQSTTGGVEQITIPILSGCTLRTQWNTNSTVNVDTARFYPCQGNV